MKNAVVFSVMFVLLSFAAGCDVVDVVGDTVAIVSPPDYGESAGMCVVEIIDMNTQNIFLPLNKDQWPVAKIGKYYKAIDPAGIEAVQLTRITGYNDNGTLVFGYGYKAQYSGVNPAVSDNTYSSCFLGDGEWGVLILLKEPFDGYRSALLDAGEVVIQGSERLICQ